MTASLYSYFGPRPIPARIGPRRHTVLVRSLHGRTTKLSFSCCSDRPAKNSHGHTPNLLEAFRLAISFRRSLFAHGKNHEAWSVEDVRKSGREIRNVSS